MTRTIIQGGIVITTTATYRADVLIDGEQIIGIVTNATLMPGDQIIEATECYVMPGLIDVNTHIESDTGSHRTADNWETGTQAAAWGGITTVIDFATQSPGLDLEQSLKQRFEQTAAAVIDYGLHCTINDLPYGKEDDLKTLIDLGVVSFKLSTTHRPNGYAEDAAILRVMEGAAKYGGIVMVYCENDSIVTEETQTLQAQGKTALAYHGRSRPILAEEEAVNRVLYLAEAANCPVYILNCSSPKSVQQVRRAVQHGVHAYCETCPQYLLLDESVYLSDNPEYFIMQPPLRTKADTNALWKLITMGIIDVISTDHTDYTLAQKLAQPEFSRTPNGVPGLETLLPLMYTHSFDKARSRLTNLVSMMCATPARLFGLDHRKGDIRAGLDADIVIYDPRPRSYLRPEDLHNSAGYTPYEGHRLRGAVRTVLCRGQKVIENRQFVGTPGYGQFLKGHPLIGI